MKKISTRLRKKKSTKVCIEIYLKFISNMLLYIFNSFSFDYSCSVSIKTLPRFTFCSPLFFPLALSLYFWSSLFLVSLPFCLSLSRRAINQKNGYRNTHADVPSMSRGFLRRLISNPRWIFPPKRGPPNNLVSNPLTSLFRMKTGVLAFHCKR